MKTISLFIIYIIIFSFANAQDTNPSDPIPGSSSDTVTDGGIDPGTDTTPTTQVDFPQTDYSGECPFRGSKSDFKIGTAIENFVNNVQDQRVQNNREQQEACTKFKNDTTSINSNLNDNIAELKNGLGSEQDKTFPTGFSDFNYKGEKITCENYPVWLEKTNSEFWNFYNISHDDKLKFHSLHMQDLFKWYNSSNSQRGANCLDNYTSPYNEEIEQLKTDEMQPKEIEKIKKEIKSKHFQTLLKCVQERSTEVLFEVELQCKKEDTEFEVTTREEKKKKFRNSWHKVAGTVMSKTYDFLNIATDKLKRAKYEKCPLWRKTMTSLIGVAQEVSFLASNPLVSVGVHAGGAILGSIFDLFMSRKLSPGKKFFKELNGKRYFESSMCYVWEADKIQCNLDQVNDFEKELEKAQVDICKTSFTKTSSLKPFIDNVNGLEKWLDNSLESNNNYQRQINTNDKCFKSLAATKNSVDPFLSKIDEKAKILGDRFLSSGQDPIEGKCITGDTTDFSCVMDAHSLAEEFQNILKETDESIKRELGESATYSDLMNDIVIPSIKESRYLDGLDLDRNRKEKTSSALNKLMTSLKNFDPNNDPFDESSNTSDVIENIKNINDNFYSLKPGKSPLFGIISKLKSNSDIKKRYNSLFNDQEADNTVDLSRVEVGKDCYFKMLEFGESIVDGLENSADELKGTYKDANLAKFLKNHVANNAKASDEVKNKIKNFVNSYEKNKTAIKGNNQDKFHGSVDLIKTYLDIARDPTIQPKENESKLTSLILSANDNRNDDSLRNIYELERTVEAGFVVDTKMQKYFGNFTDRSNDYGTIEEQKNNLVNFLKEDDQIKGRLKSMKKKMVAKVNQSNAVISCENGWLTKKKCKISDSATESEVNNFFAHQVSPYIRQCLLLGQYWQEIDSDSYKKTCALFTCKPPKKYSGKLCYQNRNHEGMIKKMINDMVEHRQFPTCGEDQELDLSL